MVHFNAKKRTKNKAIRLSMILFFIPTKEKRDYFQWLKEDQIGVFLVREYGSSIAIFINKKTREPLRDKKVIDRIAAI